MFKVSNKTKKVSLSLFLASFVLLILFFPWPASAAWYDYLTKAVLFIPTFLIAIVLAVAILISGIFLQVTGAILNAVISPGFMSLSYTRPDGPNANQIIEIGLDITQNLANLVLVILLVVIALSIALKLQEYGTKKMLAHLIIIALLVNFAPVIVGLIVDASNIVMNYFFIGIKESASDIGTGVASFGESAMKDLFSFSGGLGDRAGLLMQAITQIILNIGMAIAFFLFAGVLLVRYVVIWVLVILAPLAFVFWILPATKRFWTLWWTQLIQWSVIAIPIAFFLYLGMKSFVVLQEAFGEQIAMPGVEATVSGWFNDVFPFFVVLIFLFLGFSVGLKTGAMGGAATINLTKRGGKWAGRKAWRGTRALAGRAISSERAEKWKLKEKLQRQATLKPIEALGKSKIGKALAITGLTPAWWAIRRGVGEAALRTTEAGRRDVGTAEEKYKGTLAERKAAAIRAKGLDWSHRVGALNQAIEEGQIAEIKYDKNKNPTGITDDEIKKIGKAALRVHPDTFKKIRDAFPHLAEKMGEGFADTTREKADLALTSKDTAAGLKTVTEKIIAKIKPANISKMDEAALKNTEVEAAIHLHWTGRQVGTAASEFGKPFMDSFMQVVKAAPKGWYDKNNPKLATYLRSSAARGLGISL